MTAAGGRLAVLGAGKMGETLLRGLLDTGAVAAEDVVVTAAHEATVERLAAALGVAATTDNRRAVDGAGRVLLGVKPQTVREVLAEVGDLLAPEQLLVSIAAGVPLAFLEEHTRAPVPVVRAMPNTPALVGAGMTALAGGRHATAEHVAAAEELFRPVGRTLVLDERHFDAVTGLSASGPAFLYIVIESLAEGGVKAGLPRRVAIELAAQTCLGAGRMVLETASHPALLKDAVTTPAGCTVDGILKLEEGGLRVTLIKAVVEAARRAGELFER
ncbi:MAG TPA: pyrroline-5-carboxylate reductase [Thermoanaerobaculia bacterium]|nr:pyrroline-5-carboxylate reductase [Thermoanaerobaculia bacterium]